MFLTSNHCCLTDSKTYITCKLTIVCVVDTRFVSETRVKVCHEWCDVLRGSQPPVKKVTHVEEPCIQQQHHKLRMLEYPVYLKLQQLIETIQICQIRLDIKVRNITCNLNI